MQELAEQHAAETGESVAKIVQRWAGSPTTIAEDLFRVRDAATRRPRDLELFPYQEHFMWSYFHGDSSNIVVLKGRRIGMTYITLICFAIDGLRYPTTTFPIVAQTGEDAKKRISDLREIFELSKLPLDPDDFPEDNKKSLVLPNGTRYESFASSGASGRGDDPSRAVLLDEKAFFEDQESTFRSFGASAALGGESKIAMISTPRAEHDMFMRQFRSGSPTGYVATVNGEERAVTADHEGAEQVPIAIKQPSFKNPESIDIHTSLHEQGVEPVRPDMDVSAVEMQRAGDPKGFAQEYLCDPASEEYQLLTRDGIDRAMARSGVFADEEPVSTVMGVDLAFGGGDDSAVSIFDHYDEYDRSQVHIEFVGDNELQLAGISTPDLGNAKHIAQRVIQLARKHDVEHIIFDSTGGGITFEDELRSFTGRGLHGFNFSDQETLGNMFLSLNYGLHNEHVELVDDETLETQLKAVEKQQKHDRTTPKYTGKNQAPDGKDDGAMATAMSAYPVMIGAGVEIFQEDGLSDRDVAAVELADGELPLDSEAENDGVGAPVTGQSASGTGAGGGRWGHVSGGRGDRRYDSRHT